MLEAKSCQPWIPEGGPLPREGDGRLPGGGDSCSYRRKEDRFMYLVEEALGTGEARTGITLPVDWRRSEAETV